MKNLLACSVLYLLLFISFVQSHAQVFYETLSHQNNGRSYIFHIPETYEEEVGTPVIFVFHGIGATASNIQGGTRFDDFSDQEGFIAVYPQAVPDAFFGPAWNCGTILNTNVDDIGFIHAILDTLETRYNINRERIYMAGFSMGGIMSNYMGCRANDLVRAIASVSGPVALSVKNECQPEKPIPVMYFHGNADATVSYSGSGILGLSSAFQTVKYWSEANGCMVGPDTTELPNTRDDGISIEAIEFTSCEDEADVIHYKLLNGPHFWPQPDNDIYATEQIVEFFALYGLRDHQTGLTGGNDHIQDVARLFPNPARNSLYIDLDVDGAGYLDVVDLSGRRIVREFIVGPIDTYQLDISNLSPGIYMARMEFPGGSWAAKFLVE